MAQTPTTNYHFHIRRGSSLMIHVQFISITPRSYYTGQFQDTLMSTRQAVFAFLTAVLVNLLQLKFQGKNESPFETSPKTAFLAVASLIAYCIAYDLKLRISGNSQSNLCRARNFFVCGSLAFSCPLALASIVSILVPGRLCPVIFSVAILFGFCNLPPCLIKTIWNWVKDLIREKLCLQLLKWSISGFIGLIFVRLPSWIPGYPTVDQTDLIPSIP